MKSNKGFAPIAIVLIIIAVLAVGGIAYYMGKSSNPLPQNIVDNNLPPKNQNNVTTPLVQNTQADCLPTTAPWIKVLSPAGGEIYTVGQQVAVKWTSCNVQNVWLGLMSGGKDFGEITYPNPVPASQGSYQWTTSNPAKAFTQSNTNSYQIGVESQSPNVLVKSGTFSVNTPAVTAKLISFTGSKGEFYAESNSLTSVKVYYYPTGTEITQPSLLGSMGLTNTDGSGLQKWMLSAYIPEGGNTAPSAVMATSIYAIGYVGTQQQNRIDYSYTGASDIATHLY